MTVIISGPAILLSHKVLKMHLMGSSCLGVIEKEVVHVDSSYRVSCSLIPQKDRPQSNQTPDLWLKLQSVQFRAERETGGRDREEGFHTRLVKGERGRERQTEREREREREREQELKGCSLLMMHRDRTSEWMRLWCCCTFPRPHVHTFLFLLLLNLHPSLPLFLFFCFV